jgi:hypothetical protein
MTVRLTVRNGALISDDAPPDAHLTPVLISVTIAGDARKRGATVDAFPREAWLRLGQHLKQRRPQIDPRYRIRKVFAEENDLTDKTVQEIENAYRTTFSDVMLSTVEHAYRLRPGSIQQFLDGGELEPLEPATRASPVALKESDDTRLRIEVSVDPEVNMEQAVASLGELTSNERILVANLQAMEYPPAAVAGAVLLLRGHAARRGGQQDTEGTRKQA